LLDIAQAKWRRVHPESFEFVHVYLATSIDIHDFE
jgi:hypothetical protein